MWWQFLLFSKVVAFVRCNEWSPTSWLFGRFVAAGARDDCLGRGGEGLTRFLIEIDNDFAEFLHFNHLGLKG